jgi:undecaprenyl-diphosphatase
VESPTDPNRPWWRQRWGVIVPGFGLAFMLGVGFALVAMRSSTWHVGAGWERVVLRAFNRPVPAVLDAALVIAPWFGTNITTLPFTLAGGAWLWVRSRRRDLAMRLFIVQIGSYLLNPSLKAVFDRERPDLFDKRGWYGWSAYPSGHAITSIAMLLTFAIVLQQHRGWRWPYPVLGIIALLSILSRMYLGVHWPTDVIAGALVGTAWLLVTIAAFRNAPTTKSARTAAPDPHSLH